MIDYSAINLEKLIIHKVGNKQKGKENSISENLCNLDENLSLNLINFFLTPFAKHVEINKFSHHADLEMNELYSYAKKLFNNTNSFKEISINILGHLFEQSDHPHIKTGELLVSYFTDMIYDNQLTDVLGIFKIERKQNYFKLSETNKNIGINFDTGIHAKKLDKGCLVINMEEKDGFRVLSVDNNNYDAEYWKNKFLDVEYVKDFYYKTSQYVDFVKSFSEEIVEQDKGKDEQIVFLNKSMNYLTQKEEFDINDFANEVFEDSAMRNDFFDYKKTFEKEKEIEVEENFQIAQNTVKAKKRAIKSLINLDTNIQIKLDSQDPESTKQYIEKGFDANRQMNYYKVFYYNEKG